MGGGSWPGTVVDIVDLIGRVGGSSQLVPWYLNVNGQWPGTVVG